MDDDKLDTYLKIVLAVAVSLAVLWMITMMSVFFYQLFATPEVVLESCK